MIFNLIYNFIKNNNKQIKNYNLELYLGGIIYFFIIFITKNPKYLILFIPLDLYILNNNKNKSKYHKQEIKIGIDNKDEIIEEIDNNINYVDNKVKKRGIIKNITEIIYNYFYNKQDEYIQKKININDTMQHTLDNLKVK